jgi:hypothetical protein
MTLQWEHVDISSKAGSGVRLASAEAAWLDTFWSSSLPFLTADMTTKGRSLHDLFMVE